MARGIKLTTMRPIKLDLDVRPIRVKDFIAVILDNKKLFCDQGSHSAGSMYFHLKKFGPKNQNRGF